MKLEKMSRLYDWYNSLLSDKAKLAIYNVISLVEIFKTVYSAEKEDNLLYYLDCQLEMPGGVRDGLLNLHNRLWEDDVPLSGKYVAFEGLDGSGKDTQKDLLVEDLKNEMIIVDSSSEPHPLSEQSELYPLSTFVRRVLSNEIEVHSGEMYKLFAIVRAQQHFWDMLVPKLYLGENFIYGRSIFSNLAYQNQSIDEILSIEAAQTYQYKTKLFPDVVVFVDVDPDTAMKRIRKRGLKKTLYEKLEKLTKTREVYLNLSSINWKEKIPSDLVFDRERDIRWIIVDGNKPIEEVNKEVRENVFKLFRI